MMLIGITRHRGMPPHTARLIDTALREALPEYGGSVTGVASLADGRRSALRPRSAIKAVRSKSSRQPHEQ